MALRIIVITMLAAALLGVAAVGIANNERRIVNSEQGMENSSPFAVHHSPDLSFTQPIRPISTEAFLDTDRADEVWMDVTSETLPKSSGTPVAGVVNHHTLADDLIARFFAGLKASRPDVKRFVIISPDHFNAGRGYVSTHVRPYDTGVGEIAVDKDAVQLIIESGLAVEESGVLFEREHGIGALIPFLARAYPEVTIVLMTIRGDTPKDMIPDLTAAMEELWDERTVIILSADMSHYLTTSEALKNDVQTLRWLEDGNQTIAGASDDYIDNGKAASAIFAVMEKLHSGAKFTLFDHDISSSYGGDPTFTTSYITGVWSN